MNFQTTRIAEDVWALGLGASVAYVIKGVGGSIAIDAGLSPAPMPRELSKTATSPEAHDAISQTDIRYVFITHSDTDHIGGLPAYAGADVYLSEEEEQMINGSTIRGFFGWKNRSIGRKRHHMKDGEEIEVCGHHVMAISTPGHTLGSMSYMVDEKYLFVGDAIHLRKGEARPFWPGFLSMDNRQVEQSIRKIANLEGATFSSFTGSDTHNVIELLATGHSGWTTEVSEALAGWR